MEEVAATRHKYRICEVVRSDKKGRPKRIELIAWDGLSAAEVKNMRELQEPRLRPRQVAELDGRTVARGEDISQGEVEETEPVRDAASVRVDNPAEFVEFACRVSWDVYQREADASRNLREELREVNRQSLEQGKQVLELFQLLRAEATRPPPAPPPPPPAPPPGRQLTIEDITKLVEVGAAAIRDILRPDRSNA